MKFIYKAKKGPSEIVQGEIDAETEDAAFGEISAQGLVPIKLTPAGGVQAAPAKKTPEPVKDDTPVKINKGQVRIPHKELNIFIRQFSIMQRASVPLLKIFEVLQKQTHNRKFQEILRQIQDNIRGGSSLSESLRGYPKIFSPLFVNMVSSGEVSGTLDKVLMRLADFSEQEAEIRSKVKAALIYPAFLFLAGVATVFILLTFVMPRLMGLFADLGTELPSITRVLVRISGFCQSYWIFMAAAVALIVVWLRSQGLSEAQQKSFDQALLKLPMFGKIIEKAETARFLRSLELLYEGGIPLYQAVAIAAKTISNTVMREQLETVPKLLEGGSTLAASLEKVPYLSSFVTNMVSVGEESGQLGISVRETAAFYEQETNQFIKVATSLIEPMMILGVGLVIGFIIIAMLLPIFEISALAK